MAYRYEKQPNGKDAIVINGWENGIAPDPYSGLGRMLAVDLETPGEVAVGYPVTASTTSGATLGVPIADSTRYFVYGTPGVPTGSAQSYAILDANGRVWESTSISGTWTFLSSSNSNTGSSNLDGLCYWLGYLFKTRGANIDYWNGSTWATGWKTDLTGTTKHFMYVGSDNVLYITNGNWLASISAPTPTAFDPTSSGTYAYSKNKLQLPVTDISLSIAEVGSGGSGASTLLIGGTQNAVYPWDKVSSSFALPIYVADSYIKLMISVNQNVFIFPGNTGGRGRIYITNGSQADLYFKIPDYIFGEQDPYYEWGDAIFHNNNLVFGFFVDPNSGSAPLLSTQVWAISLHTKAFRSISEIPASGTAKSNATVLIAAPNPKGPGFSYIVGWDDNGSAPGIGYSGTIAGFNSTGAIITTDLIPVGTFLQKTTFSQVEFKLRSPLQSGESIQITPLVDGVPGSALTFSPTPTTGSISAYALINFEKAQWLSFQIQTIGNSASSGVRLRELRVI